ncbi:MBL fold metallo-hydrolase [Amaricoccus macauensis]|uniref:MBL fold metallo-hydrolase n=1 Tax=Amaricoccus macauensis TaxID=57001 RepID=UPI003C7A6380
MGLLRFTILGCGSSGGVPRLGGLWGACDPQNPRNRRRRCSLLVERIEGEAVTRVLIDTTPDMRDQLLDAGVGYLDGVVYTHAHADHVHGIDDLRQIVYNRGSRLAVWADPITSHSLVSRFSYAFVQPPGSAYPPILDLTEIDGAFEVDGEAGPIRFEPHSVAHGRIEALGYRIKDVFYLPDVSDIPEPVWDHLGGLDTWIVDALRYKPHPTHAHLEQSLAWIERAKPRRAVLTNMHLDLDYETLQSEIPEHVSVAYDGLVLETPA